MLSPVVIIYYYGDNYANWYLMDLVGQAQHLPEISKHFTSEYI